MNSLITSPSHSRKTQRMECNCFVVPIESWFNHASINNTGSKRMKRIQLLSNIFFALAFSSAVGLMTAHAQTSPARPPAPPAATAPPFNMPSAPQPTTPAQSPTASSTPQAPAAGTPMQTPAADPKDVATMDSIVAALYDVISGPGGQKRNWDRFRSLFVPGARLIPTGRNPQTGDVASRVRAPQ